MIYGSVSFNVNEKLSRLNSALADSIHWASSAHYPIAFYGFEGGIFTDSSLPFVIEKHLYLDESKQCMLLLSGEIFACLDFRPTESNEAIDAAFLWQLYLQKGPGFVQELNGDFCILIYLAALGELIVFRDHLGLQPFSYSLQNECFYFSSDYFSLCKVLHKPGDPINLEALLDGIKMIAYTELPNPEVSKLLPGHSLTVRKERLTIERFWFPENIPIQRKMDKQAAREHLHQLIVSAVSLRSNPALQAASHLSGGLDSALICALAKKNHLAQETFFGFSWSPEESGTSDLEFDERELVKACADYLHVLPVFVKGSATDWLNFSSACLPNAISFEEEFALQFAREHGIHLLFSGWGGDDFASIRHYGVESDLFFKGKWLRLLRNRNKKTLRKKLAHLTYTVLYPALGKYKKSIRRMIDLNGFYLRASYAETNARVLSQHYLYKSRRERHLNALRDGHLAARAEAAYLSGMRYGLVYRYPLLDKNVIEFVLSLPSEVLYDEQEERSLFREICSAYLPPSVCHHQRKTDPVLNHYSGLYYEAFCRQVMSNFSELKSNPELNCFNFELLEKDYALFLNKKLTDESKKAVLFCTIFNLQMLNDWIRLYRN